jgi:hypothetical protein
VVGDRGPDLVIVPGFISHLDLQWTDLGFSRFLERLASFTRLILYDKPGTGLSDPIPHVPTFEERIADIRAVLDAVGSERTALLGFSEGGPACDRRDRGVPDRHADRRGAGPSPRDDSVHGHRRLDGARSRAG